jgi:chorismate mutase
MFVSESKFQSAPHDFIPHILSDPPNSEALAGLITKPAVEAKLLIRLGNKARVYGGEMDADGRVVEAEDAGARKIDVDQVVRLYRDYVIPLTKDVEVRLDEFPADGPGGLPDTPIRWRITGTDRSMDAERTS